MLQWADGVYTLCVYGSTCDSQTHCRLSAFAQYPAPVASSYGSTGAMTSFRTSLFCTLKADTALPHADLGRHLARCVPWRRSCLACSTRRSASRFRWTTHHPDPVHCVLLVLACFASPCACGVLRRTAERHSPEQKLLCSHRSYPRPSDGSGSCCIQYIASTLTGL